MRGCQVPPPRSRSSAPRSAGVQQQEHAQSEGQADGGTHLGPAFIGGQQGGQVVTGLGEAVPVRRI
ncbi:MAG TPA: hypothetical protein VHN80_30230, partial [Kineosporiaceae bacterium]|nr:hypothetical protein [Kineosporiaceae bacterium]